MRLLRGRPSAARPAVTTWLASIERAVGVHSRRTVFDRAPSLLAEHPRWRVWQLERPVLDCDVAALYGERFVETLAGEPSSAFLADGSEVTVYKGSRI